MSELLKLWCIKRFLFFFIVLCGLQVQLVDRLDASGFPFLKRGLLREKGEVDPGKPSVHRMGLESGKFLVASNELQGQGFRQTVVLLLDHSWNGAMGVVINRPTRIRLEQVLKKPLDKSEWLKTLFWGGPVSSGTLLMLIQSAEPSQGIVKVAKDLFWVQDRILMEKILEKGWPAQKIHLYAGYAIWTSGQLEDEIMRGSWHIVPADAVTVFGVKTEKIWEELFFQSISKWGHVRIQDPQNRGHFFPSLFQLARINNKTNQSKVF